MLPDFNRRAACSLFVWHILGGARTRMRLSRKIPHLILRSGAPAEADDPIQARQEDGRETGRRSHPLLAAVSKEGSRKQVGGTRDKGVTHEKETNVPQVTLPGETPADRPPGGNQAN